MIAFLVRSLGFNQQDIDPAVVEGDRLKRLLADAKKTLADREADLEHAMNMWRAELQSQANDEWVQRTWEMVEDAKRGVRAIEHHINAHQRDVWRGKYKQSA